jgi:hypothetical protein
MIRDGGETSDERIEHGFRLLLARPPHSRELAVLKGTYRRSLEEFRSDPDAADQLLSVGVSPADESLERADLAALSIVASALLNLDETVTKE